QPFGDLQLPLPPPLPSSLQQSSGNMQPPLPASSGDSQPPLSSSSQQSSSNLQQLPLLLWPPPPPPLPTSMPPPLQSSLPPRPCTAPPVLQSCEALSQMPLQTEFEATTITRPKRWARAGQNRNAARRGQNMYQRGGRGKRRGSDKTLIQYINPSRNFCTSEVLQVVE
ncbi:hypothetical protein PV327_011319, partial [Microctonus hyperodae]